MYASICFKLCGGGGTRLGALILEKMAVDYRTKSNQDLIAPTISNCVVEPYNALLAARLLLDHSEVSIYDLATQTEKNDVQYITEPS